MKLINIIYDDSIPVDDRIKTIIGKNSYGKIIIKRKTLYDRFLNMVEDSGIKANIKYINSKSKLDKKVINGLDDTITFHYYSNFAINNMEEFVVFLKKIEYVKDNYEIKSNGIIGYIFKDIEQYEKNMNEYLSEKEFPSIEFNACIDISVYQNLLFYISSGFDARYFNSIVGDSFTVVKKSKDKEKMKKEYNYYWLLPENMKSWMVMPYDYKETGEYASYTMERLPMTDIAIRWTHQAIDEDEFRCILDKTFYFFSIRKEKKVSKEEYDNISRELYLNKVNDRIKKLKQLDEYKEIENLLFSTKYKNIDNIFEKYKKIYELLNKKIKPKMYKSVIGHGDVFFANMLYSKEINLLRLIDPKGALKEKDLWTNPYYDIAKLSHSICGNYDFFNTSSYDIYLNNDMSLQLSVHFDNTKYVKIFKEYLASSGYDYDLVRIYEASLFLSMLPLHIDNPHKVLGFILNAINIIDSISIIEDS